MAKLGEKHYKYLKDENFKNRYVSLLNNRLVYSNNKIEEDGLQIGKLYDAAHIDSLSDNLDAFEMLLRKVNNIYKLSREYLNETDKKAKLEKGHELRDNSKLTQDIIIKIANTINKNAANGFLTKGYRVFDNNVKFDGKYPIEESKNIPKAMEKLLYDYYNTWRDLDIFEREAKFNIEFLRIHPFDDGNGRTSRLILNYNLLVQGHAPVLMPEEIRNEYFDARNRQDVNYIKDLFESESQKELEVLDKLITRYEETDEKDYSL